VRPTAFRRCGSERAVHTRSRAFQAKKRETWRAERRPVLTEAADVGARAGNHMVGIGRRDRPVGRSEPEDGDVARRAMTTDIKTKVTERRRKRMLAASGRRGG